MEYEKQWIIDMAIPEEDTAQEIVEKVVLEEIVAQEIEAVIEEIKVLEKCIKQFVLIVVRNVKFHLNLQVKDQYIVENVSVNTRHFNFLIS
jgi:hypothetical protein